ncbi:hypothetical protein [Pseudonocardia sp. HH130630-07]|uniref:hypothetical protein n=1 Tax=Pseudonocardia sp. HH130630-07 TaxID=1690815 RepID=UPI000814E7E9|nr:hypothetical protein [Pseudonocardia sp. HH130630-07]ANY06853.1 hypothetical protein AFB00_11730 [Pseudonocardia sp. HH130630-07]
MDTITGDAAGVPFTALPPAGTGGGTAPLLVTWHMLDAPRTDAAFAAALPMAGVPAWRVHLGMPLCGSRMVDGRLDEHVRRARADALTEYLVPVVRQAVEEFPAALAALRDRLPFGDGPVGLLGASLGGLVALEVLAAPPVPVGPVALVNPAVRVATGVGLLEAALGGPYRWTPRSRELAAELDFVARAGDLGIRSPLLLVSGEQDDPTLRADAAALVAALRSRHERPDDVVLTTVPDLAHPLAEEPGLQPAPQLPGAVAVDRVLTEWFARRFAHH